MELQGIETTWAKTFYLHFDSPNGDIQTFVAILEPSKGMLTIITGSSRWSTAWPEPMHWGTETFEEFLCARPASWITSKVMGNGAQEIDFEKTERFLRKEVPNLKDSINSLLYGLRTIGLRATQLPTAGNDELEMAMGLDCLADVVFYKPTSEAVILAAEVIPCLQKEINPNRLRVC